MTTTSERSSTAENPDLMPTVAGYLKADRDTPPECLFERSTTDLGNGAITKDRYVSRAWHELEKTKLWKKVWQMACRENEIPDVGDQIAYDVADQSVIVVRVAPDEIRAYHNACRHRGTRLVEGCTSSRKIQCSFHAWTWNLDGSLERIPCRWDFPQVDDADYGLRDVQVGRWNGFVFVNLDPQAAPLEEYLGEAIPRHFENWPRDHSWKAAHVGKVLPCNWKVALEAFLEVYHVVRVHPNFLPYAGDCNAQYDFWGPHGRMLSCVGVPSPHFGDVDPQDIVNLALRDAVANMFGEEVADGFTFPTLEDGQGPREVLAQFVRLDTLGRTGVDLADKSDAEMIDGIQYYVFPNLVPWGGYAFPITYRVRPNGDDHRSCVWEVMFTQPVPSDQPLPRDVPLRMTPSEEPWAEAKELAGLGPILDQDMVNLLKFQRGLESDGYDGPTYSDVQERNIRNLHLHLDRMLGA